MTPALQTVPAKTIVTKTKSAAWFGNDYNMNLYRGCCHGCIYCDSRSECYGIEQFDTVRVKENALETVRNDLRRKTQTGVVGTGSMSDPYNPFEQQHRLTRYALELLAAYGFGVTLATKSPLVTRDIDVLQEVKAAMPVLVKMTITTADDALCAKLEPRVAPSSQRFAALRALADAGLCCGVLLMPVLPFLEDSEENVLRIVEQAAQSGARFVYPAFGVTLRANQRAYFYGQLDALFPGVSQQYARRYGGQYECRSPRAARLWEVFCAACDKAGLLYRMQDIVACYRQGYGAPRQLSLFD